MGGVEIGWATARPRTLHPRPLFPFAANQEFKDEIAVRSDAHTIADECADVLIVLYGLCDLYNRDLHEAVDKKMAINRDREWFVDDTGAGQHIEKD